MQVGGQFARLVTHIGGDEAPSLTIQEGERLSLDRVKNQLWVFFWRACIQIQHYYEILSKESQRQVALQVRIEHLQTGNYINFKKVGREFDYKLSRFMREQFAIPPPMAWQPRRHTLRSNVGVSDTCDYHTAMRYLDDVAKTLCGIVESIFFGHP